MSNYDYIHHPGDARQPLPLPQFISFNTRIGEIGVNNTHQAIMAQTLLENEQPPPEQRALRNNHAQFYVDLLQEDNAPDALMRAAFLSVRFASIAGTFLVGDQVTMSLPYKPDNVSSSEHWRAIHSEAQKYLIRNSKLKALAVHYRRRLDSTAKYYHVVNTVVGISLKHLENEQRQQFVDLETTMILGENKL